MYVANGEHGFYCTAGLSGVLLSTAVAGVGLDARHPGTSAAAAAT